MIKGRIVVIAKALSPIRHGGDTVGNVQMFRRHDVFNENGKWTVPFISGNSIKHFIRESSAQFALDALGLLPNAEMTKSELHLLFSGGAMTKSGASVNLKKARDAEAVFPTLSLCGYSAGNTMQESQMRVDFWEVVCEENRFKLAKEIKEYAPQYEALLDQPSSDFLDQHFGTRHEPTRRKHIRDLLSEEERNVIEKEVSDNMTKKNAEKGDSLQMIFEYETLMPGTVFVGGFSFPHGITEMELAAFRSAFTWASEGVAEDGGLIMRVGGAAASGHGKVSVHLHGLLAEGIEPKEYVPTDEFVPPMGEGAVLDSKLADYVQYLRDNSAGRHDALKGLLG